MSELKREHTVCYQCNDCKGLPTFDSGLAFRDHLQKVHQVTATTGKAQLVLHLDTATHFFNSYEGEIGGVKFSKTTNTEREGAFRRRCLKAGQ